jgi:hypothetical protein
MKKFLQIYLGFFIVLPLVFCIVVYLLGCFISWSILEVDIQWLSVRLYAVIAFIVSIFLAADE